MLSRLPEFRFFPFKYLTVLPRSLARPLPPHTVDPWEKREAWRFHPFFSQENRIRNLFPGLGLATVAFIGYVAFDKWYTYYGPGKEEAAYWAQWMKEREARIKAQESHH